MKNTSKNTDETRRRILTFFSGIGLGGTLLPGVLWAQLQQESTGAQTITAPMLRDALALSGLTFGEEDQRALLQAANQNLTRYEDVRKVHIPNDVAPPFYFSAIVPGMKVNRTRQPLHFSTPRVRRPPNLEDVAFWPVTQLSRLLRTRQVTSVELTQMYLTRLHRYNDQLNFVVTFLDDLALSQARQADAEIAAGKHKGPLHGIPWGAKDIIAVKGHKTTWGSGAYKDQVIDEEASVVEMLRDAGAVLLAKLASGELASGDRWFGGQTRNPWNTAEGSSGSSAGPGSATAAGCVGFSIGSETSGSILSPSARCGVTGLRPTFGRVSRYGVMALSWTQDRLGPLCRYSEDCAVVMSVIAKPDGRDLSVSEIPFNWNATLDIRKLRVGYLKEAFDETSDPVAKRNEEKALAQVQALGAKLIPVTIPDGSADAGSSGVESAAFFDDLILLRRRQADDKSWPRQQFQLQPPDPCCRIPSIPARPHDDDDETGGSDSGCRCVPGVPANSGGGGGGRGGSSGKVRQPQTRRRRNREELLLHATFAMANSAGYPAISVPNGFTEAGSPTALTFYGRPFAETEILALAKAYQDASGFHLKHPNLDAAASAPKITG